MAEEQHPTRTSQRVPQVGTESGRDLRQPTPQPEREVQRRSPGALGDSHSRTPRSPSGADHFDLEARLRHLLLQCAGVPPLAADGRDVVVGKQRDSGGQRWHLVQYTVVRPPIRL